MNCQAVKNQVFTKPEVRRELDRFVFVELYVDKPPPEGPKNLKVRNDQFKSNDLPLYVVLDPSGGEVSRLNFAELDAAKWVAFLKGAYERSGAK